MVCHIMSLNVLMSTEINKTHQNSVSLQTSLGTMYIEQDQTAPTSAV